MDKRDREAIAFARMQMGMYEAAGCLVFIAAAIYFVAGLIFGFDTVQAFIEGL